MRKNVKLSLNLPLAKIFLHFLQNQIYAFKWFWGHVIIWVAGPQAPSGIRPPTEPDREQVCFERFLKVLKFFWRKLTNKLREANISGAGLF